MMMMMMIVSTMMTMVAKLAQRNRNFLLIFSNLLTLVLVLASNSIDFHSIRKDGKRQSFEYIPCVK